MKRVRRGLGKTDEKSRGLTGDLLLKRADEGEVEGDGIPGVGVKCGEVGRNNSDEGGLWGFNRR